MTEDKLRDIIKNVLPVIGGHASWVESHETSPGFPDLDWCFDGHIAQIELKVVKIRDSVVFRPTQYRWLKDRVRAGGRPVVIIGDGNSVEDFKFYILPAQSVYAQGPIGELTNMGQLRGRTHYTTDNALKAMEVAFSIASNTGAWKNV